MKYSTATSVLVNYLLEDAIEKVILSGFNGIDIWCGRPHLFRRDYSFDYIKDLGDKIRANGLQAVSVFPAFFRYPFSLSSPVDSIAGDSVIYMKECIENAKHIGADYVLVVPTNNVYGQTPFEARDIFVRNLSQACEYADLMKIGLNIEVLNPKLSSYIYETGHAVQIIREIGYDRLGIALDTGHLNLSGEDPESAIERAGENLVHVHVNDNNAKEQQNAIPTEGNFDFAGFGALLKRYNYSGFLTLELGWPYSADPEPALKRALSVTKALFES